MSPEELRAHVTQLREITSSPQTLKKSLMDKKAEVKAATRGTPAEPKASSASIANKYLNLGKKTE